MLIRAELDPHALPDEPVEDLLLSYAVLALALGETVTTQDVHDAWVAWMLSHDPEHPSLVPFDELDPSTAHQDSQFVSAIRTVAQREGMNRRLPSSPAR